MFLITLDTQGVVKILIAISLVMLIQRHGVADARDLGSSSDMTRYLTYLGLCVATFIIFQNSPMLASGVGVGVALYVTTSEYMLGTIPVNNEGMFSSFLKYFKS